MRERFCMQRGDTEGKGSYTKAELLSSISTSLAGRAAEIVYYGAEGGLTTGATADLQNATRVARYMICHCGMDEEIGLVYVSDEEARENPLITKRVGEILKVRLDVAVAAIEENRDAIDALVALLLEKNHLRGDEIDSVLSERVKK